MSGVPRAKFCPQHPWIKQYLPNISLSKIPRGGRDREVYPCSALILPPEMEQSQGEVGRASILKSGLRAGGSGNVSS